MLLGPVVPAVAGVLGLVLGSFLNVCIYRLPEGHSVAKPRSRCPSCGAAIRAWHNIPIVSWILLRARCASCRAPISWRYPAVEALSGILALVLWRAYGPTPGFLVALGFGLGLVVLFFTDWDHQILPDAVTLTGFVAGLAVAWFNPFLGEGTWARVWASLAGAALGAGFLWGVGALYSRVRHVEAMGLGDVKMMAMVGAFTGPSGVLFTLLGASVVGAVVGVAAIPLRGRTLKDTLPFGCFLAPAAFAALIVGRRAFQAWLALAVPGP